MQHSCSVCLSELIDYVLYSVVTLSNKWAMQVGSVVRTECNAVVMPVCLITN